MPEEFIKKAVSGFVEWQPKVKIIEEKWLRRLATTWRANGFLPLETAAVEYLSTLEIKGEIDKEIYVLSKLGSEVSKELALHYDLTIPLARYVIEQFANLSFPFKRYQIQKVWRGERPQFGRYREFYQADLDVIDVEALAPFYDAQVLCLGVQAMLKLKISPFRVGISNRKIYEGYLLGLGVADPVPVLRIIDKLDKIGAPAATKLLVENCGLTLPLAERALHLSTLSLTGKQPSSLAGELGVQHEVFVQGLRELEELLTNIDLIADAKTKSMIYPDLSFVRGFDYYTGSIFEGKFTDDKNFGSICSGGRYDNLAEGFGAKKLPGVGFSIGITRILAKESQQADKMRDFPKQLSDFCLILDGDNPNPADLLRAGQELKSLKYRVNTISVKKLKKGLQIAARTEASVALFAFGDKLVFKHLASGKQIEIAPNTPLAAPVQDLLGSV